MSAAREAELAALVAEQEADARYGDRINYSRELSFESPLGHDHDAGTLAEVVGDTDEELDGLLEEEAVAVRRIPRPQRWKRTAIKRAIREWVAEHGELPRYADWNYPNGRGIPSAASVARCFGSWSEGIKAAGFEPRPMGGPRSPRQGTRLRPRIDKRHKDAFLTTEQIAAAYVLYDRHRMSIPEIADRLWRKYGYESRHTCITALHRAFHAEGFRLRTKSEARLCLSPEKRKEIARRMAEGRRAKRQREEAA